MTRPEFERMIRESGRDPFERDANYRRVVRDADGRVPPAPGPAEPVPLSA
jgi:hypothetical protein